MRVTVDSGPLADTTADLAVMLVGDGLELTEPGASATGAGDARPTFGHLTLLRPGTPERLLAAGAGPVAEVDAEKLRELGAKIAKEAKSLRCGSIAVELAPEIEISASEAAAALVTGMVLGSWSFDRFRSTPSDEPEPVGLAEITIHTSDAGTETAVEAARIGAEAANRARVLQAMPANLLAPSDLAARAEELANAHDSLSAEILDRAAISERGLGGLEAVSLGSAAEPRLITLRYSGRGSGEVLGLVGKAVTFDSGGISIKPSGGMHEMKMDMSGGAAVLEAMGAIAELGLEADVVAVIPSTENMPSGTSMRPGDVITQLNGKTVEVNNTDAEGRLILADALTWCVREMGADRVVDFATLTGAVLVALGSTYSALISNDDDTAAAVEAAAGESGELTWRLPLHPDYKKLTTGKVADLTNSASKREAGTIYAGSFLEEFVDGRPWAHVDIAGTAWDSERAYAGSGPTGFGVRMMIALASKHAGA